MDVRQFPGAASPPDAGRHCREGGDRDQRVRSTLEQAESVSQSSGRESEREQPRRVVEEAQRIEVGDGHLVSDANGVRVSLGPHGWAILAA